MDSGGHKLPLQPLFHVLVHTQEFYPFNCSPHFPSKRTSTDQEGESFLDWDNPYICKLPVVLLFWCNTEQPDPEDFRCGACGRPTLSATYYACLICEKMFHKECVESPFEIIHPSHPFHSLRLTSSPQSQNCICCHHYFNDIFYHCSTCKLIMHPICAMRSIPFAVDHPKSHSHPLTFYPAQASLVSHFVPRLRSLIPHIFVSNVSSQSIKIVGVSRMSSGYLATTTVYLLPLLFYLEPFHAESAENKLTTIMVWDGKELEGVPEENDKIDDGEPFKRIADGIILHPFHSHHLQLEIFRAYDENTYCRGCALPIYEGQFYSCMECDFILHESCANAPCMKRHPLHPYPLTLLNTASPGEESVSQCTACRRLVVGFYYFHYLDKHHERIALDLRCASIIEPFEFHGHKHPLYLPWEDSNKVTHCQICKEDFDMDSLEVNCMECDYTICFHCASLPEKVRYKHDSHFLMICDGKEASDKPYWCEICEGKIEVVKEKANSGDKKKKRLPTNRDKKERKIYKCNDCCTTLHAECLLGQTFT
ncbi:putative chromatin regulator PHD family [Arabidopsis thaliana]